MCKSHAGANATPKKLAMCARRLATSPATDRTRKTQTIEAYYSAS
jgi:hypothetical protein